ncbi:hypothetical protein CLD22_10430 [Rubrivivax gelatinosus]|nr:hypothetical protein [Rubrivivax gelatinosus]
MRKFVLFAIAAATPFVTVGAFPEALAANAVVGPSLFGAPRQAREDWEGARQRVRLAQWQSWIRAERQQVDTWMARPRDREDLVAGWIHDYVDQRTGIPQRWSQDAPEPADDGRGTSPRFKQAWVARMREINILRTLQAARLFRLEGEARYGDWAVAQLEMYARAYRDWPLRTDNGRARMFRHGLDEATFSFVLLDAVRTLGDRLSQRQIQTLHEQLFEPMADNLKTMAAPLSNIGLWHAAAIAAIAMRLDDGALLAYALDGEQGVRATIRSGLTADDIWKEGSLAYNAYVANALARLLLSASLEGRQARLADAWPVLARLVTGPLKLRFDDGTLPTPGDGNAGQKALDGDFLMRIARLLPNRPGAEAARQRPSWDQLLDPVAAPDADAAPPPVTTTNLPAVRMAVLRAGGWQAFVHYGQAVPQHAQQEALAYELHHRDIAIVKDSGTVLYGSPYHRDYFSRGPAQNVPLVDGAGQRHWASGTVEVFDRASNRLVAGHDPYAAGSAAQREYRVSDDGFSETTRLRSAAGERRLGAALHTPCEVSGSSGLRPAAGLAPPRNAATAYWTTLTSYSADARWELRLRCQGRNYRLAVSGPQQQTVFIGQGPTVPLPARQALVYYETTAAEASFALSLREAP